MKILYIHTYYLQRGGEDTVFEEECALINQKGQTQILTFRNKPGWRGAIQFLSSSWNIFVSIKLEKHIRLNRPDIIHVHNWHYATGPIVIRTAKRKNIPIVLTLHNYRLLCPSATLLNKGNIFTDSIKASFPWKAVAEKVYRNSTFQTFWLAFVIWFHKGIGTWKIVDKFIVLTDFSKSLFVNSSLKIPAEKFVVKPNFVNQPDIMELKRKNSALFVGRLSEEKGIKVLLEAFRMSNYNLVIAGDGPLKNEVYKACKENKNLQYVGNLDRSEVQRAMQEYQVLIFPSTWYEGMPLTILEAFASGMPVIASNLGAMASMIKHGYNGLHFDVGNSKDLNDKLNYWYNLTEAKKEDYRRNAYASFLEDYTAKKNMETLFEIYQSVTKK